jgi:hypothetical protein
MKKIIFFVAVVTLYSCSKQTPSTTFAIQANPTPLCDSCQTLANNAVATVPLEIKSADWEVDGNGGFKKDLYLLYYSTYPWDYGLVTIDDVVLNYDGGVNAKVIVQGKSLDYLGATFSLKGNNLLFSGDISLLPETFIVAIQFE